jgi:hydrogenase expression/formation protein HypD
MLVQQLEKGTARVENQYVRSVKRDGNFFARQLIEEVMETCDTNWRGIGMIPASGLRLRQEFVAFDAEKKFSVTEIDADESAFCIAGAVLQGKKKPHDCPAFGKECTPENPLGAPMVSTEGACSAYYAFRRFQEA